MTDYDREAERDRTRENSARQAWAFGFTSSTGIGRKLYPGAINFGLTMYQKPIMSYGYEISDADPDGLSHPSSVGFVYEWIEDERGFYTGAYVGVYVSWVGEEGTEDPVLEHHFTFTAKAFKDIANVGGEDS